MQFVCLPVEVTPLQSENLTDPQSQTPSYNAHRAIGFRDVLENLSKLFYRQHNWLTQTLRDALYPHEAHRVALIREQLPSHRAVEDDPHLILQVSLALRREVEPLSHCSTASGLISCNGCSPHFGMMWFLSHDR